MLITSFNYIVVDTNTHSLSQQSCSMLHLKCVRMQFQLSCMHWGAIYVHRTQDGFKFPSLFYTNTTPLSFYTNSTPLSFYTNSTPLSFYTNSTPLSFYTNSTPLSFYTNSTLPPLFTPTTRAPGVLL